MEGSLKQEYTDLGFSLEKLALLPPLKAAALFQQSFLELPRRQYVSLAKSYQGANCRQPVVVCSVNLFLKCHPKPNRPFSKLDATDLQIHACEGVL